MTAGFIAFCCFSDDTHVHLMTKNGDVAIIRVEDVQPGSCILTMDKHGNRVKTEVAANYKHEGAFGFLTIVAESIDGEQYTLTITDNHWMIRAPFGSALGDDKITIDHLKACMANTLRVGDLVPVCSTDPEMVAKGVCFGRITALDRHVRPVKYEVVTAEGTVLADGVVCTTMCHMIPIHWDVRGMPLESVLEEWRAIHLELLDQLSGAPSPPSESALLTSTRTLIPGRS